MSTPARRIASCCAFVSLASSVLWGQAPAPALADLLQAAGKYVVEYEQAFSAVVLQERYFQVFLGAMARGRREQRNLKSDVLLIQGKEAGWVTFRDVYEVDGRPVRDHDDRLANIVMKPSPDSREQAKRITEEGARFNLGPVTRTINAPALALVFLRTDIQPHVEFRLAKMTKVNGQTAAEIQYQERSDTRLVQTKDRAPASGRFWIEPGTGAVLKSEFVITSMGTKATIEVMYAPQEKLGMLLPSEMFELYELGAVVSSRIEGRATYSNFRRFSVDTSTIIK